MTARVFVSFDLDHDNDLQRRISDDAADARSRIEVYDWSIRETAADWRDKLRKRIANVEAVVVICGGYTDRSANVAAELELARETQRPYYFVEGRPGTARRPAGALPGEPLLEWKQETFISVSGTTPPAPITTALDDLRPTTTRRTLLGRHRR